MKKIVFLLLIALSVAACKKKVRKNEITIIGGEWHPQIAKGEYYDSNGKLLHIKKYMPAMESVAFDCCTVTMMFYNRLVDKSMPSTSSYTYQNGFISMKDLENNNYSKYRTYTVTRLTVDRMTWQEEYKGDDLFFFKPEDPERNRQKAYKYIRTINFERSGYMIWTEN